MTERLRDSVALEPRGLSLSARLIFLLTLLVGVVMALGGWFILRQRVAILESATRNELRAHATTLQLALEGAYRDGRLSAAQRLIDRLSQNPKVYSVILFDEQGQVAAFSNPLAQASLRNAEEVRRVLTTGETFEFGHEMELLTIIMPLRLAEGQRAAFEVTQPATFIAADRVQARRDILLITLALFGVIVLGAWLTTRYGLLRPLNEFVRGATAVGEGQFEYRVIVPRGGHELARLAHVFNQMAAKLAAQRDAVERTTAHELEMERKLRQSERLAVVGRVAAGVAHELGAPLNVIKGRVGMVQAGVPDLPDKHQRNLTIINAQADAITHLVRQLLNLARPFHLQREKLDLCELASGVCELVESDARKNKVKIELPATAKAGPVWVEGDRRLLHQVLLNLVLNGLQAMEGNGGGTLRFMFENGHAGGGVEPEKFVMMQIADSGTGIGLEHLEHIFDPFFTTKEVGQGTGLGLAVSRRIVEEHGGRLEAANHKQGGAIFTLWLPRPVASAAEASSTARTEGEQA